MKNWQFRSDSDWYMGVQSWCYFGEEEERGEGSSFPHGIWRDHIWDSEIKLARDGLCCTRHISLHKSLRTLIASAHAWHEPKKYFQLIGYPKWWRKIPSGDEKSSGRKRGQQQNQRGGLNGGHGQGGALRANAAQTTREGTSSAGCGGCRKSWTSEPEQQAMTNFNSMLNNQQIISNDKMTGKHDK